MTAAEKKAAEAAKDAADKAADKGNEGPALTKIKMERSHPSYGYHAGETGELTADKATELIKGGFAQAVTPQTDETR